MNFKNIVDSFHPELPFGIAQIGKAFRNEIAPRDFVFRAREFEQMEIEFFVRPAEWKEKFEEWRKGMLDFITTCGIKTDAVHELEVPDEERAHYSKRTIDFEFEYPFGKKELYGLAYRTDFDLKSHQEASGANLKYTSPNVIMKCKKCGRTDLREFPAGRQSSMEISNLQCTCGGMMAPEEQFWPHVIEPSFGVDRTVLAILTSAYTEDELGGEKRIYLALKPQIAPIKVAVFPLVKNKPDLVAKAREIYTAIKKEIPNTAFDDNGNIGKRYRRQDEIGTPWCVTIDYKTLEDDTVTIRDRDSGKQERNPVSELDKYFSNSLK